MNFILSFLSVIASNLLFETENGVSVLIRPILQLKGSVQEPVRPKRVQSFFSLITNISANFENFI